MSIHLTSRIVKRVAVVRVAGELDIHTSPKLKSSIRHLLTEGQVRVIVNLLETTYLDGQALAVLAAAAEHARANGGKVGLVYSHPLVTRLFSLTGLQKTFPVFRTEAAAVRAALRWPGTLRHA